MFPLRSKEQVTRHTAVCDRSRSEVGNSCHAFYRRPLTMHASQARRRILGHKHCKLPTGRPFFPKNGLRADSIFGQVRDTTVQVWTVGEGFGIGSELSQTCCAANNFGDHESFFLGSKEEATKLAALHRGKRADLSARSPSVLEHYATLTCVAFDFATGVVGRCTFSTPSRNSAVTFVLSASSGSVKLRRKVPKDRSMRWNFFFRSSF